ncbi:unnamed protein product [marine sediment metagenome]|uniref:Uncharacterized protein n=1 Tax=marine sediment metagenome TaxID=412755 RepID=X1I5U2_9ZZZZ
MKRRDFLKLLGVVIVAPSVAIVAIKAKPEQHKNDKISKEMLKKFRMAFKNTKFKRPMNKKFIIIYDEFDYTTINFICKNSRRSGFMNIK